MCLYHRLRVPFPGLGPREGRDTAVGHCLQGAFPPVTVQHRKRTITVCSDFSVGESHCMNPGGKQVESSSCRLQHPQISQGRALGSPGLIRICSPVSRLRDKYASSCEWAFPMESARGGEGGASSVSPVTVSGHALSLRKVSSEPPSPHGPFSSGFSSSERPSQTPQWERADPPTSQLLAISFQCVSFFDM